MDNERPYDLIEAGRDAMSVRMVEPCRADALLLAMGCSKASAGRVFAEGRLLAGGVALGRADAIDTGRVATLAFGGAPRRGATGTNDGGLVVLYEDRFLLAVEKPAGLLVHGDGTGAETLASQVAAHVGGGACVQPVQRLDVDTTGVVLFSLTEEFQPALDRLVAEGGVRKRYLAIVSGEFPAGERVLSAPIGRDRHDARRMRVSVSGKSAITRVGRLAVADGHTLLLVELVTGRRHQIRVHLSSKGFPLVGDELYGGEASADGLMLHAYEESLVHPVTGERLGIRTAWPRRFERWFAPMELG